MTRQKFSRDERIPNIYEIPKIWTSNRCLILLTSEQEDEIGEFRLVDVILRAQDIIAKCPPNSKAHLGGIAVMGIQTFFVTVDGPHLDEPQNLGGANQTMQLVA